MGRVREVRKPWTRETSMRKREEGTFLTHPCLDCLRPIRWDGYRCYDCERSFKIQVTPSPTDNGRTCLVCGAFLERDDKNHRVWRCKRCVSHLKKHPRGYRSK